MSAIWLLLLLAQAASFSASEASNFVNDGKTLSRVVVPLHNLHDVSAAS